LTVRDNGAVDSTFPRARKPQLGYNTAQVEEFLQVARRAYDGTAKPGDPPLTSEKIRLTAFAMQKGGYSTAHVDAAL
jgi:DivIVA domain-containing protein